MKITILEKLFEQNPSVDDIIGETIAKRKNEEAFYVCDVNDILCKHKNWLLKLPRVRPYYAVKCNSAPIVLQVLSSVGIGFDCASKTEIDTVLDLGVPPEDIIYANPCKTKSFITHAASMGVDCMTFDNEMELYKIRQLNPNAKMILRIKVDDSHSVCRFSAKFGAELEKVPFLLQIAKKIGVNVVGCSFHVGSGCEDSSAYRQAISNAKQVFDIGLQFGFNMHILDIGGGFPGVRNAPVSFDEFVQVINESLDVYFPEFDSNGLKSKIKIIAEPGRYYVASAFTLVTNIIAKRSVLNQNGKQEIMYYINDGVYGSFNCIIFDHVQVYPNPFPLNSSIKDRENSLSTIWGPTCDSMDCVVRDCILPQMEIGEWIVFPEMGAYTLSAGSNFNGFKMPTLKYYLTACTLNMLKTLRNWSKIFRIFEETDELIEEDDSLIETFSFDQIQAVENYIKVY
ncbi:Ornithine decarboxylase [Sarcoptes scabiei]|uniref:ornithine decarboxylase n=1 Tax=Sarcoptes scabiei TaxID=52283 RepID=A0A131ZTI0_SARSC|nr:Ornithine decarboxylase [Sarcoptes scabiei]KPM01602.1 ornithine decarboxylase 2-like protein [Sarcoptes scabiei]